MGWAVVPPQFYSHGHNQLVRHPAPSSNLVSTPFGAGRSISLIGILGGVLFILLIVAFITCIRRRKRWSSSVRDAESDGDLLAAHLHQLQQLRSSHHLLGAREAPPDYTTVCKQKAEEEEGGFPPTPRPCSRRWGGERRRRRWRWRREELDQAERNYRSRSFTGCRRFKSQGNTFIRPICQTFTTNYQTIDERATRAGIWIGQRHDMPRFEPPGHKKGKSLNFHIFTF